MKKLSLSKSQKKSIAICLIAGSMLISGSWWISAHGLPTPAGMMNPTGNNINTELPDAKVPKHPAWTKLDFYKLADADSAKRKAALARDPYYRLSPLADNSSKLHELEAVDPSESADERASELDRRIAAFNHTMQNNNETHGRNEQAASEIPAKGTKIHDENMAVNPAHTETTSSDPEINQLDSMLNKVIAIQHPERQINIGASATKPGEAPQTIAYKVDSNAVSGLGFVPVTTSSNNFYSVSNSSAFDSCGEAFAAVIPSTQSLVSGSVVKIQLMQEMRIANEHLSVGQLMYGHVSLNNDRLNILIPSILVGQRILTVKLQAYDLDGLAGIAMPGGLSRDAVKQSAGQSISNFGLLSMDPSIAAQAASASIEAAKTLLHKKVQLVRVLLPAGYQLFLKNQN